MTSQHAGTPAAPGTGRPASPFLAPIEIDGLLFLSGQLPYVDGALASTGTVGGEVSVAEAQEAARVAAELVLARVERDYGLDRVRAVARLTVYVASAPGFVDQPSVANAASAAFVAALGDRGRHSRSAVGVAALPKGAPVEVEATLAITPADAVSPG